MLDELRRRCDMQHAGSDGHSLAVAETAGVLLIFFRAMRGNEAVPFILILLGLERERERKKLISIVRREFSDPNPPR
jgi:hypothetical protein